MYSKSLTLLTFGLLVVLAGVVPTFLVRAQTPEGLRIIPAVLEERGDPGKTYSFELTVTNLAAEEKVYYLFSQDILGLDDQGLPIFSEEEPTEYEMSTWFRLPYESVTLGANETRTVPFSIIVPQNVSPGSHFGGVFFNVRPPRLRTVGTAVGLQIGTVVSMRISGEEVEEGALRAFQTDALIYDAPTVTFTSVFENVGNTLLRPQGVIEIVNMFGSSVASIRVNESGAAVFPKSLREFETLWEHNEFAFGRYQAIASLSYGLDERKTVNGTVTFWVLPLTPILTILGVLLLLIVGLFISVRLYIRKKLKEMGVGSGGNSYVRKNQRVSTLLTTLVFAGFLLCFVFLLLLFIIFA